MTRFANPKAAQAMMQTHGHTNLGMPPKPGFSGAAAPTRPGIKPTVTGAPATPITPKPMVGLGQAMSNLGIKKGAGNVGRMIGQRFGGLGMKKGGKVSSASKRADGCAVKGKTKGKIV